MARDFRPKDKKKAPRPSADAAAAGSSAPPARPAMARPVKAAPRPAAAAAAPTDSGNSSDVDDDTLMREIAALGGSKEDLELVGRGKTKGKGKGKAEEEADDPRLGDDVMSFMKQLNFSAVAPKAEPPKAKPAKESAAAEAPAPKKKEKAEKKAQPAAAATATAAPAVSKAAPAAASPEKKEKAKPGKKEREAAKAAAAAAPLKASASSSSAPEQAAPAPTNDWKAERERKMAAEREAKIAAISQAAAAPPKAKAAGAKKGGASKGEQRLLFAPAPHWSTTPLPTLPAAPASEKKSKKGKEAAAPAFPSDEQVASLHAQGKALLEADNRTYSELMSSGTSIAGGGLGTLSSSDAKFISSLLSGGGAGTGAGGGTLSDRIAALTLLVQSSPLHNMHSMESLLSMASKKGREESGRATRALGDWLASAGGLGARKLRYFRDQPMLPAVAALQGASSADATAAVQGHLILYAFEDALKHFYFSFLQLLEAQTHDTLPFVRKQAVTQTYVLLRDKSEQEQNLLRLLVNKLGDSERAVASKASGHLLELLATHPAMKAVVVREVAQLVLRPPPKVAPTAAKDGEPAVAKYNTHARYYGVLTLNQTLLTARDDAVAANLVNLYFELFESVLQDFQKSTGGKEETIADAEAAAAAAEEEGGAAGAGKKDKKGRWRDQKGKKGKGGKANKAGANDENKAVVDADAKMMAAILTGVRRAFPFAKLDTEILDKHMDTLFRITHSGTFNISIQALQLIFQVAVASNEGPTSTTGNIADRFYTTLYSSLLDARLATTSKQAMYLNLLFKALKADDDERRSKACVKRLLQTTLNSEPPWICGTLFLLGELMKARPSLRVMLSEPEDEGEERFVDQAEDEEEAEASAPAADAAAATTRTEGGTALPTRYDARKRDPRWAGAELTCLWEVVPLLSHFHPSVALHAEQLLLSQRISTTADLSLNTLAHFLDRFVYRNPKTTHASKGSSIMQPAAAAAGPGGAGVETSVVRTKGQGIADDEYVNSEKFWRKKAGDVPVDQLFFHQYFNMRSERTAAGVKKSSKRKDAGSDDDDAASGSDDDEAASAASGSESDSLEIEGENDSSDEEAAGAEALPSDDDSDFSEGEKEIWAAMKRTMPREEGDEDLMLDSGSDDEDDEDIEAYNYSDSDAASGAAEGSDEEEDMSGSDDDDDGLIKLDAGDEEGVFSDEDEDDLLPFHGFDEPAAAAAPRGKKRAAGDEEEAEAEEAAGKSKAQLQRAERKKRKAAPMFASAEDYAHLIDNNDGEDMA